MVRRWIMFLVLMVGLCGSAGAVDAWGGHRFGGPRVAIGIGLGPLWVPDAAPVVVSPPVMVPPAAPPTAWYYCDHPRGY